MMNSFKREIALKKTMVLFVLSLLLFIIGTAAHYKKTENARKNDFNVYYKTSERIEARDWTEIYTRKDGAFPYRYVPYTLIGMSWIGHFPETEARKMWLVIQALGFGAGFFYLYRSLIYLKTPSPLLVVSITFLFTFRQYLDSLYSGQIAGLFFLSLSLGLYFYLRKKYIQDLVVSSFAASLKILPGFLIIHGLIQASDRTKRLKLLGSGLFLFLFLNAIVYGWLSFYQGQHHFFDLWRDWLKIVLADGEYFDGSTPKSQSLRGAILRIFGKHDSSEILWKISVILGSLLLMVHWMMNKSTELFQQAYTYGLGIMAFILFMPESLPYQVMNVGIVLAILMAHPKMKTDLIYKITVILFMIVISFASTDFIGRNLSDKLQSWSLAFGVMCLMTFILVRDTRNKNQVERI